MIDLKNWILPPSVRMKRVSHLISRGEGVNYLISMRSKNSSLNLQASVAERRLKKDALSARKFFVEDGKTNSSVTKISVWPHKLPKEKNYAHDRVGVR
jgi:hypothetical protein